MSAGWGLLIVAVFIAAAAAALAAAYKAGTADEKARTLKRENSDAMESASIRDRLRHDTDFAKRVRARFTR